MNRAELKTLVRAFLTKHGRETSRFCRTTARHRKAPRGDALPLLLPILALRLLLLALLLPLQPLPLLANVTADWIGLRSGGLG